VARFVPSPNLTGVKQRHPAFEMSFSVNQPIPSLLLKRGKRFEVSGHYAFIKVPKTKDTARFALYPVFSLFNRELVAESSSPATASTANQSLLYPQNQSVC
jgi:hypothetical protein